RSSKCVPEVHCEMKTAFQGPRRVEFMPSIIEQPCERQERSAPANNYRTLAALLTAVRSCRACEAHLPLGPRPVLQAGATARILVVGQAPGARVHATGVPWDGASGARLRLWMGIDKEAFYDESLVAIIPMGYCYPGRGRGGDLPPRRECAQLWLDLLLAKLPRIDVTLLIGWHAQRHFLARRRKPSLTATVGAWRQYAPRSLAPGASTRRDTSRCRTRRRAISLGSSGTRGS